MHVVHSERLPYGRGKRVVNMCGRAGYRPRIRQTTRRRVDSSFTIFARSVYGFGLNAKYGNKVSGMSRNIEILILEVQLFRVRPRIASIGRATPYHVARHPCLMDTCVHDRKGGAWEGVDEYGD